MSLSSPPIGGGPSQPVRSARVLVIHPDVATRRSRARDVMHAGFDVLTAESAAAALRLLATTLVDVVVVDAVGETAEVIDFLRAISRSPRASRAVVLCRLDRSAALIPVVREGAHELLLDPEPSLELLAFAIERAAQARRRDERLRELEVRATPSQRDLADFVGAVGAMREARRAAIGASSSASPLLITGQTGTGKSLLASFVHGHGAREHRPLVVLDAGDISQEAIDLELVDAIDEQEGRPQSRQSALERAEGGTLVVEEVSALSVEAQATLLRAIAEGKMRSRGSGELVRCDVRVIATTSRELSECVAAGCFRRDLLMRLRMDAIHLPSLATRKDDIPLLAHELLARRARRRGEAAVRVSTEALRKLRRHDWPGNVAELEQVLDAALARARGEVIHPSDFVVAGDERDSLPSDDLFRPTYVESRDRALAAFDARYLDVLLERAGSNVSEAARLAGMDRSNFRRLLRRVRGGGA